MYTALQDGMVGWVAGRCAITPWNVWVTLPAVMNIIYDAPDRGAGARQFGTDVV
jgi:hypothetical protein